MTHYHYNVTIDESTLVAQLSKLAKDEQYLSKTKIESWATIERGIVELGGSPEREGRIEARQIEQSVCPQSPIRNRLAP
jgi:hypothetical protein